MVWSAGSGAGDIVRAFVPVMLCATLCLATLAAGAQASGPADTRIARLLQWLEAVEHHKPGSVDASVVAVASYGRREFVAVLGDALLLLDRLADPSVTARVTKSGDEARVSVFGATFGLRQTQVLLGLSHDEIARRDPTRFLKRAAVLHADVAMLGVRDTAAVPSQPPPGQAAVLLARDGLGEGVEATNIHWAFGRQLLDGVKPTPRQDTMVLLWYQAAAAFMHYHLKFGDLAFHLDPARRLFPEDADLLFACGALHESFASAEVQSVVRTMVVPRGGRPGILASALELDVAQRFFGDALRRNPDHAEARLRRARVRGLQGHHEEAAASLDRVLGATRDTLLRYYAELFLGEEARMLGRREAAREAFERAATLYPRAQSARLALSQLARESGDRAAALAALRNVVTRRGGVPGDDDPWWTYGKSAGRHVLDLLDILYRSVANGGPR